MKGFIYFRILDWGKVGEKQEADVYVKRTARLVQG